MNITDKFQAFLDQVKETGNADLYDQALELYAELQKLMDNSKVLQKKVDTKEGCYWDINSDGG